MTRSADANGSAKDTSQVQLTCGLIMPISAIDGCTSDHWTEVKAIIIESVEAINQHKFAVKLVSEADDVGVIQKRIVQNIYNSDIVVCDVSGKNPNVMFELGMRLAFDKPTVIIKDDKTDYSFDTAVIEHIPYPRDLRFAKMVTFKTVLAEKVAGTFEASRSSKGHSTFLKNFGTFHVADLSQHTVPADKLVMEMLTDLQMEMSRMRRDLGNSHKNKISVSDDSSIEGMIALYSALGDYLESHPGADLTKLVEGDEFVSELEKQCAAPRFFANRNSFRTALKKAAEGFVRMR
jgi:nucleoside 2-deoxyribosyltransferase